MSRYIYDDCLRQDAVDEFLTPPKLATAMAGLLALPLYLGYPGVKRYILEPGANTGIISQAVKAAFADRACLTGLDIMKGVPISPVFDTYYEGTDYLTWNAPRKYDAIIMNPPYSRPQRKMAELFIRKSMELLQPEGILIALLRANYPCAKGRSQGLFKEFPLHNWYWIDRPSFYGHDDRTEQSGTKKTNMHDYAIGVWKKDHKYYTTVESSWIHWDT